MARQRFTAERIIWEMLAQSLATNWQRYIGLSIALVSLGG